LLSDFGSSASLTAPIYIIRFNGIYLLGPSVHLSIPNGVGYTTNVGDSCVAEYLGSGNWRILSYQGIIPTQVVGTTNSNHTFIASDAWITLVHNDASNYTYTLPNDSTTFFPTGTQFECVNTGTGTLSIGVAGGVSFTAYNGGGVLLHQGNATVIRKIAANSWYELTPSQSAMYSSSFTGTMNGFGVVLTPSLTCRIGNGLLTIIGPPGGSSGASNANNFTITGLPAAFWPAATRSTWCTVLDNSSVNPQLGLATINSATGEITFKLGPTGTNFAAIGTKGIPDGFQLVVNA